MPAKFKGSPPPTSNQMTLRDRNIAAMLRTRGGSHIGLPSEPLIWQALAIYANSEIGRIFLDIIVATRHVTQNVDINTAEHGRARMNLPLTNPSL
jgi:hypothetical protein